MPQQLAVAVENNFTKGLITESTGLNFPENASTDTDNCEYTLVGDVLRRLGTDLEENFGLTAFTHTGRSINTYVWKNVGGDGSTQLVVVQVGFALLFYSVTSATEASPISTKLLAGQNQTLTNFVASGGSFDGFQEAAFTDGNGYLFVFHPSCDPFFCTYSAGVITSAAINIQIRDFSGIPELGIADNTRPSTLTAIHNYNLNNQGWTTGNPWSATSTSTVTVGTGAKVFNIAAGLTITPGQTVYVVVTKKEDEDGYFPGLGNMSGTVTSYVGTTLTLSITSTGGAGGTYSGWSIVPVLTGYVNTWFSAIGNYPSNADQWWRFKNASNVFDPAVTQANTSIGSGAAPKGHFILGAFNQYRTGLSGVAGLTDVVTTQRPTNGCWFQGRIWYTGLNASQAATGTAPYYTWTENIYFSQVVDDTSDFAKCYQENDPTSELLFDLLPTDGGVIVIQGSGAVYKLFPIQNGLLVFAANGVWFITGSQGIGFTANDYTITKISNIQSISSTSFINVMGLPYFWNEEGIYQVQPAKGGGLEVDSITVGTILSFYNNIPLSSKKYVRGDYHPIDYVIQWAYKSTEASDVTDRYKFDKILNYNVYNKAFYPYTVDVSNACINGINYIAGPGGSTSPEPGFKYLCTFTSAGVEQISFADIHDTDYVDWASVSPVNFVSYFVTGYKLRGQAIKRFQPQYVQMWSRTNGEAFGYKIQGIWDYANTGNTGRWSMPQAITFNATDYDTVYKRHKIRGHGYTLQFKVFSIDQLPFDIQGWAVVDTVNQST